MKRLLLTVAMIGALGSSAANAAFDAYVIRNANAAPNDPPVIQPNNAYPGYAATEFIISAGGQKAGLGSTAMDGNALGSINNISIARLDDRTRFTAGSGPYVAPYLNFWITDGLGHYAVVGNEPSDGNFQPLYANGYSLGWADLADKVAKVFENSDLSWLPITGSSGLPAQLGRQNPLSANLYTFADLAGFIVKAPSVAELTAGWPGLGSGAPRELSTKKAWGVNWIFGDTLTSYVSGAEGYVVANASVFPLPVFSDFIVTPCSSVFDANNVVGVLADAAPGFGTGSFASDGVGKTDMYFTPEALFGRAVKVGQVKSMGYWTKKGTTHTSPNEADWFLNIYTKPFAGDVSIPTWYGSRFGSEPYFAINLAETAGAWNQWTTDGANNQLRIFESTQGAPGANFGSYTDPEWTTFIAGDSLGTTVPRKNQEVLSFSIQTGSATAAGFMGQVDGVRIELTDGSVATVNFEACPQATKAQIRDELAALLPTLSYSGDQSKLQDAINHLDKSLAADRWLDALHPKPGSKGESVFNEEKAAVVRLKELRDGNKSSVAPAVFQSYINGLLAVDRLLAEIAIADAIANPPYNAGKISTANSELSKGDVEAGKDHPDKAIDKYKNAWKNALAAN